MSDGVCLLVIVTALNDYSSIVKFGLTQNPRYRLHQYKSKYARAVANSTLLLMLPLMEFSPQTSLPPGCRTPLEAATHVELLMAAHRDKLGALRQDDKGGHGPSDTFANAARKHLQNDDRAKASVLTLVDSALGEIFDVKLTAVSLQRLRTCSFR